MSSYERWVSKFQIKKYSWVFVLSEEAIRYGLKVKRLIEKKWSVPKFYYHLKSGGHVKALQEHFPNKYFIHLDILDFFGHVNRSRVTRNLKRYCSYEEAREIAIESTVRLPESSVKKFILPFGFVQSPIIASVCLDKSILGRVLRELSEQKDIVVTVYMDDIIISANNTTILSEILRRLEEVAEKALFPFNPEKGEGPSDRIKVFNIYLSQGLLEIAEQRFSELVSVYSNSKNDDQKAGIAGYVSSVNTTQAKELLSF